MEPIDAIRAEFRRAIGGRSLTGCAAEADLPRDAFYTFLVRGRDPALSRAIEMARALDLEFYVGPPRPAGPDTALTDEQRKRLERLRDEITRVLDGHQL